MLSYYLFINPKGIKLLSFKISQKTIQQTIFYLSICNYLNSKLEQFLKSDILDIYYFITIIVNFPLQNFHIIFKHNAYIPFIYNILNK